jgi:O-antigen/teichoic acid export membrane protein
MNHQIASDTGLLALSNYLGAGIGLVTTVLAAKLLGPSEYGVSALVMAYPMLLWSFISVKSVSITTKYIVSFKNTTQNDKLKSICKLSYILDFSVSIIALILVVTTSWWVAGFMYKMPRLTWLMICYAASLPFLSLTGTSIAILSSWGRFQWLGMFQVIDQALKFILVIVFLFAGLGVLGLVFATALAHTFIGVGMMIIATRVLLSEGLGMWWRSSLREVAPLQKELTGFFGWNYLMVTLNGLLVQAPTMFFGKFRSPDEAGFYRLAASIVTAGSYLENSAGRVIYPVLSAGLAKGELESTKRLLRHWTLWGGVPLAIFVLLMILCIPLLVSTFFGPGYAGMVHGTQVMLGGAAISAVFFWLVHFYYASGRVALWSKMYGIYTLFVIGLGWFFIHSWGFTSFAWLISLAKATQTVFMAWLIMETRKI